MTNRNKIISRGFSIKTTGSQVAPLLFSFFLFPFFIFAQKVIVKGTVNSRERVLHAATVVVGNTTAATDENGWFSVSVDAGRHTVVVTHAGYKKLVQEVVVTTENDKLLHFTLTAAEELGEIVVLGSRSIVQRSNLYTPVPVDVFSGEHLAQTAQVSLTQMLQFAAPSINASRPVINEPVTLRGLNPDQVLILVNGTRRHSMAYINPGGIRGMLGAGSVANDLNAIPFSAIEKVEILRDGAAAQYGSDAIAGVINIILKESTGKTLVQLNSGKYYRGDGENITAGVNHGFHLNKKGFLNFSADVRSTNPTYRGGEFKGTVYRNLPRGISPGDSQRIGTQDDSLVKARGFNRRNVSNAGSSEHTSGGMLLNGGYSITQKIELFWTVAASRRKSTLRGNYTFPKNANRINQELFPDGFATLPYHFSRDLSGIAGATGQTRAGWKWEYSSAYGNNTDKYYIKNTNNASQFFTLGKNAPTSFYTGTLIYGQLTNSFHLVKNFSLGRGASLNVGTGTEWRREDYQMKEGEEGSWKNYDSLGRKTGGSTGLIVPPENALHKHRNIGSLYADVESEITERLLIGLASRYEYYSDFGGNIAGKLSCRYKFAEKFSVRASLNNGFRAPSLQQRYYSGTNRTITNLGGLLIPTTVGIYNNESRPATAFGVPSLGAETSVNGSGGIAATMMNRIRVTVDAYWIEIKNRIVLSGVFDRRTNSEVNSLLSNYPEIDQVRFFANAINTQTRGLDVVLNGSWKIHSGTLVSMLGANFTRTRLFGDIKTVGTLTPNTLTSNTLFSREEQGKLERGQPDSKVILSLNYKTEKFALLLRNTRFGKTAILFNNTDENPDEKFSSKILTDFSFSFTPRSWISVTAGANNIFNVYPDRLRDYRNTGEGAYIYGMEASPFGFNGGYYFAALKIEFQH